MQAPPDPLLDVQVRYADLAAAPPHALEGAEGPDVVRIPLSRLAEGLAEGREDVQLETSLLQPLLLREGLLTLGEVLGSDLRFKAQDRAEYLKYLLSKGKKATKELWEAQKAFLEARYRDANNAEQGAESSPLDPIVQVQPNGLTLEVFSADESAYARLELRHSATAPQVKPGVSTFQLNPLLLKSLTKLRSYQPARLELIASKSGTPQTLRVPFRWIRAFGQMQAAATLPATVFQLAPIDLYNVLQTLRLKKAKKGPRALRYELTPGEPPRIVLEPWDLVLQASSGAHTGLRAQVVRTWGRLRLTVLARLLPLAKSVTVHLMGAGLPAWYVLDVGDATFTLALSGWTDSGWAGISTLDLLAAQPDPALSGPLLARLKQGPCTLETLAEAVGAPTHAVRLSLISLIQQGLAFQNIATKHFVYRPIFAHLTPEPLPLEQLRFRDQQEADAHRLLEVEGQVRLTRVHDLGAEGLRIEGEVEDRRAHRTYRTSFTLDREGRTVDAACTSPQFRRSGLKEGPTVPMIALRLLYSRERTRLEQARETEEGRRQIFAETRTWLKRSPGKALTYKVSLEDRRVTVRWGTDPAHLRMQRLLFATPDEARTDYFGRLEQLSAKGFMDVSMAEAI